MGDRLALHDRLKRFSDNVYFQPPSNIKMTYPCIVYTKSQPAILRADNVIYMNRQGYSLTVIDRDPDSMIADLIMATFEFCTITQNYTVDSLHHTTLSLYY